MNSIEQDHEQRIDLDSENPPLRIALKFSDKFKENWNRNNREIRFENLKELVTREPHYCHFQRARGGERQEQAPHKILIPIGEGRAIEMLCLLGSYKHSSSFYIYIWRYYFVFSAKVISSYIPPKKDSIQKVCEFVIHPELSHSKGLRWLSEEIDELNIPTVDINKEKDKKIWDNYVNALEKLVSQKEVVWSIEEIGKPYDRQSSVDIVISEDYIEKKFKKSIAERYPNKTPSLEIEGDHATLRFERFRELADEEKSEIETIAAESLFKKTPDYPFHEIIGSLSFKYCDQSSKDVTHRQIKESLYDFDIDIEHIAADGKIKIGSRQYTQVKPIVEKNYPFLTVAKHCNITLRIAPSKDAIENKIREILADNNLSQITLRSNPKDEWVVEVSAPIRGEWFEPHGLNISKRTLRFGHKAEDNKPTVVLYETDEYINFEDKLEELRKEKKDPTITQLPTAYTLQWSQAKTTSGSQPEWLKDMLRDAKIETDEDGKSSVDVRRANVTITPDSEKDYNAQIQRIKASLHDNLELEQKPYKVTFAITENEDYKEHREKIANEIQNKFRTQKGISVTITEDYARIDISYSFHTEDERESFKQGIDEVYQKSKKYLEAPSFDTNLGRTVYKFEKDEKLREDHEKELQKNLHKERFVFLSKEQREKMERGNDNRGNDNSAPEDAIGIGTLVRKEGKRLKFKLEDKFKEKLNNERDALKTGSIMPVFPGELANIKRMKKAMAKVTTPGERRKGIGEIGYPANRMLSNFIFDPTLAEEPTEDLEETKQRILQNLNEPLLENQPRQLEAVAKALIAPDMALIQGPPGTGKTTVIAEIIWQTLSENPKAKILLTSQTNLAVDNALERLKGKKMVRPLRIGNIDKFEDEGKYYSTDRIEQWCGEAGAGTKPNSNNAIRDWISLVAQREAYETNDNTLGNIVSDWQKDLREMGTHVKGAFVHAYNKHINVFAATCSECGSNRFAQKYNSIFNNANDDTKADPVFDVVIMDEASKATPPELVLPLTLGKKVIIIGDHKQLPPMLDEKEFGEALESIGAKELVENWTRADYKTSQFEKLFVNAPKGIVTSLDTQFRMHGQIMKCISQFYKDQKELENGLICGIEEQMDCKDMNVKASRWHGLHNPPFIAPQNHAIWVNVKTPEKKVNTSYKNEGEIEAIKSVLRALKNAKGFKEYFGHFKKDEDKEIGIITYYMPQMQEIRRSLYPNFSSEQWKNFEEHKSDNEFGIPFRINTVDRFQGMERNIIIISTVRSNRREDESGKVVKNSSLGFAKELQRINVGFSRARRLLIVVGNKDHFAQKLEYQEAMDKMHEIDIEQLKNL